MIYIIEDEEIMAECIAQACAPAPTKIFGNAIAAMNHLATATENPQLIFLDILLTGPDGFTFLNELVSYQDTAKIPVVVVSTLDFTEQDLSVYGVVGKLNKTTMRPQDIRRYARTYATSPKLKISPSGLAQPAALVQARRANAAR